MVFVSCPAQEGFRMEAYQSEIHELEKSAGDFHKAGNWTQEARIWSDIGHRHIDAQNFVQSLEAFQSQLQAAMRIEQNGSVEVCKSYANLGQAYSLQQPPDHQQAIVVYEKCLGGIPDGKFKNIVNGIKTNMAISFLAMGDNEKAIAIQSQLSCDTILDKSIVLQHNGAIAFQEGKLEQAVSLLRESVDLLIQVPQSPEVLDRAFKLYGNLGIACMALGQYHDAIKHLHSSLEIARNRGDIIGECDALRSLGIMFMHIGKYKLSLELLDSSRKLSREARDTQREGYALSNIANVYLHLGQLENAMETQLKHLKLSEAIGDELALAKGCGNVGGVLLRMGNARGALSYIQKNFSIALRLGTIRDQASAYCMMGSAHYDLKEYEEALRMYGESMAIAEQTGDRRLQADALSGMANVHGVLGHLDVAIEMHSRDIGLCVELRNPAEEGLARHNLAVFLRKNGDSRKAVGVLWTGLARLQAVEAGLGDADQLRISLFEVQKMSYALLQEVLLDIGLGEEALAVAELSKARALCHLVRGPGPHTASVDTPLPSPASDDPTGDGALAELKAAWRAVSDMVRREGCALLEYSFLDAERLAVWVVTSDGELAACEVLPAARRDDDAAAWGAQSIAALLEMGRAGMQVRAADGGGGTPPGGAPCGDDGPRGRPPDADRARGSGRDAAVEAFLAAAVALGDPSGPLAAVEDPLCMAECSEAWEECREVRAWLQSLPTAPGGAGGGAPARELAAAVDAALPLARSWRQLRAWTEGVLADLLGGGGGAGRSELLRRIAEHLDEGRILGRVYGWLVRPVRERLPPGGEVLIVPHGVLFTVPWPALLDESRRYLVERHALRVGPSLHAVRASSGERAGAAAAAAAGGERGALVVGNPWAEQADLDLKAAEAEALVAFAAISGVEGLARPGLARGRQATRRWVSERLAGAGWAHFACHCDLDRDALVLAHEGAAGAGAPGNLLSMSEVQAGCRLAAGSTVVLSACNTGRGRVSGEGVVGIGRAFLAAGAGAVVASLWHVRDDSTRELMDAFYEHLSGGLSVPKALQLAMLDMLGPADAGLGGAGPAAAAAPSEPERAVHNEQGRAELRALELLFAPSPAAGGGGGGRLLFQGEPVLEGPAVDGRGRLSDAACAALFGAPSYPDVFGGQGPAARRARDPAVPLASLALAASELDRALQVRLWLQRQAAGRRGRSCPGHDHMLSQLQGAASQVLAALEERVEAGAEEELRGAAASLAGSLRAMATCRHPQPHCQQLWERQACRLREVVVRLELRAAEVGGEGGGERVAGRGTAAAGDAAASEGPGEQRGPGGTAATSWEAGGHSAAAAAPAAAGGRRKALHWAGFLVVGARTWLTAAPAAAGTRAADDEARGAPAGLTAAPPAGVGGGGSMVGGHPHHSIAADADSTAAAVRDLLVDLGYPGEVVAGFARLAVGAAALAAMGAEGLAELGVSRPRHQALLLAWARGEMAGAAPAIGDATGDGACASASAPAIHKPPVGSCTRVPPLAVLAAAPGVAAAVTMAAGMLAVAIVISRWRR